MTQLDVEVTAAGRLAAAQADAEKARAAAEKARADREAVRQKILQNQDPRAAAGALGQLELGDLDGVTGAEAALGAAAEAVRLAGVAALRERVKAMRRGEEAAAIVHLFADAHERARKLDLDKRVILDIVAELKELGVAATPVNAPLPEGEYLAWRGGGQNPPYLIVDGHNITPRSGRELAEAGMALAARRTGLPVGSFGDYGVIPRDVQADPEGWARRVF